MASCPKPHECPIASKTKRKSFIQPSQSDVDDGFLDDEVESRDKQVPKPFADADEPLIGPFSGGPHDPSVLKSFKSHIAAAIWFNKERDPLRLQNHSRKLTQWVFDENVANHKFWNYIEGSGLRPLVIWDPYCGRRDAHPLLDITFYTWMLKCLDIVEPYYPERVLRQFGRVQTIPQNPYTPSRFQRVSDSKSYKVVYEYFDGLWQRWRDHVLADDNRSTPVKFPYDCTPEYLAWYQNITHPYVQYPDRMSATVDSSEEINPLQRISRALYITQSILDAGRDEATRRPAVLYEAIESVQHILLGSQVQTTRTYQRHRVAQNN